MFLSNSFIKSRFSFMSYALRLSAISVMALTGATNLGWGSVQQTHNDLDDTAVVVWQMRKFPDMCSVYDHHYQTSGGSVHKKDEFSIFIRRVDGIDKIRVLYHGHNDHSLTPLNTLEKSEFISAGELGKILGIAAPAYKEFMETLDIPADTPTFPSNIVEGYQWINSNDHLRRLIITHSDPQDSLWSIAGGPVSLLGAVKVLIESAQANHGKPVRFHVNLMGFLPDYSWDFLNSLNIRTRVKAIKPTSEGKWFPVLKQVLSPSAIALFEKTKQATEKKI